MIHPSHGVKIFVATKPVDFRKGHDGLAVLVQGHLKMRPFDGAVYVFRAKRADRLKMIWWDGSGLVMAYKRLEQNAFKWPAIRDGVLRLDPAQFEALFCGAGLAASSLPGSAISCCGRMTRLVLCTGGLTLNLIVHAPDLCCRSS